MYLQDLIGVLDSIYNQPRAQTSKICTSDFERACCHPKVFEHSCPDIKRVTFNGDTTIVFFVDGTYAVVKCSAGDKYDRKTAIVYAMAKRMLGKLGKTDKNGKFHANEVDGAGFGSWLQDVVDKGFDQQLEEKTALEKKRAARVAHDTLQAAQKQAAFEKRVEARAKDILLERAAIDRANELEDAARKSKSPCSCKSSYDKTSSKPAASSVEDEYVKPDKPFSQFTSAEKREYWRYHNAKRKQSKK